MVKENETLKTRKGINFMNYKYLIVKCEEFADEDYTYMYDKIPLKITEDYTKEDTDDCEVYEILPNGIIGKCVKSRFEFSDSGIAFVFVPIDEDENPDKYIIINKFKTDRETFALSHERKILCEKYFPFYNTHQIIRDLIDYGSFRGYFDEVYNGIQGAYAFVTYDGKHLYETYWG
jgi:hypothetical protein